MKKYNLAEYIDEGIIIINNKGIIEEYNTKAKEIFGLKSSKGIGHDSGVIKDGDMVFIVDSMFSNDDGGLMAKDLEIIGISGIDIEKNQGLLCCGIYKSIKSNSYKIVTHNKKDIHHLQGEMGGLKYKLELDTINKNTKIVINDTVFEMSYIKSIGNIVIYRENQLIFYQEIGYTAKSESIKDLLQGKPFSSKGIDNIDPIGEHISMFHPNNKDLDELLLESMKKNTGFSKRYMEINQRPVLASIVSIVSENETLGAILKVEDITQYIKAVHERDEALLRLKEIENLYQGIEIFPQIVGTSDAVENIRNISFRASQTEATILLLGDSGTGKTYLAKKIHNSSLRREKPFVVINCASIPKELMESELFGYEKNSFTGASTHGKKGLFEVADGGTVFLDEIGDMPINLQSKLLHFLQSRTFMKIGAEKEIGVNVRVIAATNKNLVNEIKNGKFREDLYYRINVIPIFIPSLKERREDIPILINHVFERLKDETQVKDIVISSEAFNILTAYDYPGNIREMENIIHRAISINSNGVISPDDLMLEGIKAKTQVYSMDLKNRLKKHEKRIIVETLIKNEYDIKSTYKELGIGKTNFYGKLKEYSISLSK